MVSPRDRSEHVAWCKQRALRYVEAGDLKNAFASLNCDLRKHPDTEGHAAILVGTMLFLAGQLDTPAQMREWIKGVR